MTQTQRRADAAKKNGTTTPSPPAPTPARIGRPPSTLGPIRVWLRGTPEELDTWKAAAALDGLDLARWLKMVANKASREGV